MEINAALREEIEKDITRCEAYSDINGSESLYGVLVAKYSVLDPQFSKGLSANGKTAALGSEFDFRQELKAIAAKLRMWLLTAPSSTDISPNPKSNPLKEKVYSFIQRGEEILVKERHVPERGIAMPSYVAGPLLDAWMGEINIFNDRYLRKHPLHNSIHTTYFHYKKNYSSCEDMLGHLRALAADDDFFDEVNKPAPVNTSASITSIEDMLKYDITRCQEYITNPTDEKVGLKLYIEVTSRYDSVIKGFGNGLYQYYAEQRFYDPEISGDTLLHNLTVLLNKMLSYQAQEYGTSSDNRKAMRHMSNKVFIVHGHDEAAKETMARTLEKAGFEAIILHEQASSGNTIIEKIEANTDVSFAVVLYTQCDLGRAKDAKVESEKYRARQNVVFEHGYLIAKLGRNRVCALVKGDVETPGDISGVVYISMDAAGAWKMQLAKEMKSAGLLIDMDKFFT